MTLFPERNSPHVISGEAVKTLDQQSCPKQKFIFVITAIKAPSGRLRGYHQTLLLLHNFQWYKPDSWGETRWNICHLSCWNCLFPPQNYYNSVREENTVTYGYNILGNSSSFRRQLKLKNWHGESLGHTYSSISPINQISDLTLCNGKENHRRSYYGPPKPLLDGAIVFHAFEKRFSVQEKWWVIRMAVKAFNNMLWNLFSSPS